MTPDIGAFVTSLRLGFRLAQDRRVIHLSNRPVHATASVATVFWQRLDVTGMEQFELRTGATGPQLQGTVIVVEDNTPMRLDYEIACSPAWETRSAEMTLDVGDETRRLELVVDDQRRWWANGEEITAVAGQINVDLSLTPATNLLPVRHLGLLELAVGEPREAPAAWVLFPQLEISLLSQRYTRVAERRFAYESQGGDFRTEIEVDEMGLVVYYPPFWKRVAVSYGEASLKRMIGA